MLTDARQREAVLDRNFPDRYQALPRPALEPGDLVIGHEMGAYTAATKTRFNSLPDARFVNLAEAGIGR